MKCMAIKLHLLSTPRVEIDGKSENIKLNSPSSLLIYLAYRHKWIPRAELAFLYKPDEEEGDAKRYLRLLVHRAKGLSWANGLEIERQQIRFLIDTDVAEFQRVIEQKDWQKACAIYTEPLLNSLNLQEVYSFNSWLELERNELEYKYQNALKENASILEQQGNYNEAADNLLKLLKLDSTNEEIVRLAMRNAYLGKQIDLAKHIYEKFRLALKEELDLEPLIETQNLLLKIENLDELEPIQTKRSSFIKLNLPAQTTRFIGRKNDLKNLNNNCISQECRLLSLVGLGGIGKTRLGLELARSQVANYPDGVFFIALADIKSNMLANTIARALEISITNDSQTKDKLLNYLKDKKLLLILDNFEHILEAKSLVAEILESSTKLKIVITSRVALNLRLEHIYDLRGLSYPEHENEENLADFDAIKLFISSANRVMPSLEFDDNTLKTAAKITNLVEGMPLAIELSSAWLRIISVEQLLLEIQKSLDMLSSEQADVAFRHRNVRAVFDYSWQRLGKKQKDILKQLAVFKGGFSLEAAEEVAGAHLSYLLNITNESLIRTANNNRFNMHELIRKYISEKLKENKLEHNQYKLKHAKYFAKVLSECNTDAHEEVKEAMTNIEVDIENIRLAWQILVDNCQLSELNNSLSALDYFYSNSGLYEEAKDFYLEHIKSIEAKCQSDEIEYIQLMASLKFRAAICASRLDIREQASHLLAQALELAMQKDIKAVIVKCYFELGIISYKQGQFIEAEDYFLKTQKVGEDLAEDKIIVDAVNALGLVAKATNKHDQARAYLTKAISLFEKLENKRGAAMAFSNLGNLEEALANYNAAQKLYYKALPIFEELNFVPGVAVIKGNIGVIEYRLDNMPKALEITLEALELKRKIQSQRGIALSYINLARIYAATNESKKVKAYLYDALDLAMENNFEPTLIEVLSYFAHLIFKTKNKILAWQIFTMIINNPKSEISHKNKAYKALAKIKVAKSTKILNFDEIISEIILLR